MSALPVIGRPLSGIADRPEGVKRGQAAFPNLCGHENLGQNMHFDSSQYNRILWANAAELSEQLYYRIVATI
jgi:hypothetical protein